MPKQDDDYFEIKGRLRWDHFRDGELVESSDWIENIITTTGKNALSALLISANAGNTLLTHIGFGTSTTAVLAGDTALGIEVTGNNYARAVATRSNPSANVVQCQATLTNITPGPVTVQEAGLFNALTVGTLFAHQLTGAVTLSSASDSLQLTWQVTFP